MQRVSGRNRFEHGADTGLKSNLTQPGVADTGIEDAGTGAIVVVPDHRRQSEVITQGIGELHHLAMASQVVSCVLEWGGGKRSAGHVRGCGR